MATFSHKSSIDWASLEQGRAGRVIGRLSRDIGIALVAGVLANLIWNALPGRHEKITAQIVAPAKAAVPAATNEPSQDDMRRAAQFEQMALSRVSQLKPEAEVTVQLAPPLLSATIQAVNVQPLNLQPATLVQKSATQTQVRNDPAKLKQVDLKAKRAVPPMTTEAAATIPALYYAPAEIAPREFASMPPVEASWMKRMVSSVPGAETATGAIGSAFSKSADFVGSVLPKF